MPLCRAISDPQTTAVNLCGPCLLQSITALAHLRAAVLYVLDISEQCGYTLAQQAALFHSIKPLFANKPLMIVANKTDVAPLDSLAAEDRQLLQEMVAEAAKTSAGGESGAPAAGAACLVQQVVQALYSYLCAATMVLIISVAWDPVCAASQAQAQCRSYAVA